MNTKVQPESSSSEGFHRVDSLNSRESLELNFDVQGQQRRLRDFVDQLRSWLYEVEQLGIPKFGETGYRLRGLRQSLNEHFDCCRRRPGEGCNQEFEDESQSMLLRLDDLIHKLEMPEPPFHSWQQLVQALTDFTDDLESIELKFVHCGCE